LFSSIAGDSAHHHLWGAAIASWPASGMPSSWTPPGKVQSGRVARFRGMLGTVLAFSASEICQYVCLISCALTTPTFAMDAESGQDAAGNLHASRAGIGLSESLAPIDATLGPAGPGGASGSHQISSGQGSAEAKAAALAGPPHITEFCQKLAALEFP